MYFSILRFLSFL